MNKGKMNLEDFKELIDSRNSSKLESREDKTTLLKARLESAKESSSQDVILLKLYRLKLMLEDEAKTFELKSRFHSFSSMYVDLLYNTRKSFADDIDFSETQLSLILNGKRPPTDEFVSKIRLHSDKIYKKLNIDFDVNSWFIVYYLDRMSDYVNNHQKETVSLKNINKIVKTISVE